MPCSERVINRWLPPSQAVHERSGDTVPLTALSDQDLAQRTREGDPSAFGELWRRHRSAVRSAASSFAQIADPDDIVQEAFTRVFTALVRGEGPRDAVRPYLYRTVRNVAVSWSRRRSAYPGGDLTDLDVLVGVADAESEADRIVEDMVTARAFRLLASRWREVLWYTAVEDMTPREVGQLMGLSPNAVAALAVRAREGLRVAWINAHMNDRNIRSECRWAAACLAELERWSLPEAARSRIGKHFKSCRRWYARRTTTSAASPGSSSCPLFSTHSPLDQLR